MAIHLKRIDALKKAISEKGFDGYLICNNINQQYFLGFPGTSALLVPRDGESTVYVYSVNYEQAKAEGKGLRVELVRFNENLMGKIAKQSKDFKIKKMAVDSLDVENWNVLTKKLEGKSALEINGQYVQTLREVKDNEEIELMRRAGELTSEGMEAAAEAIKLGAKENTVAAEIEYAMRKRGSGPTAFDTIVASGVCSAFPHGGCSGREIREGDLIVVDIGATFNHYCSDMTRTFVAGEPTQKQRIIHKIVRDAQEKAFQTLGAGVPAAEVDASARKIIEEAGYGEFFVHRLGHGVGLEVHEPPTLYRSSKFVLSKGNVVTDEPGIYLPGYGGVRIEDTVLIQAKGAEKLTLGRYTLNLKD